jgi:glycine/D-amino acid oxidase-like deaminating enzyme
MGKMFTDSLVDMAKAKGAEVIIGKVVGAEYSENGTKISAISYVEPESSTPRSIPVTEVILAAGPWSGRVFEAIKPPSVTYELPIFGTRSHSILISTPTPMPPLAVFASYEVPEAEKLTKDEDDSYHMEFYPRPTHLYVCGPVDKIELPDVEEVDYDSEFCDRMFSMTSRVSRTLQQCKLEKKQSCFMPMVKTTQGLSSNDVQSAPPLIGKMPMFENLVVATGHSCWGMMLSAGTGYIVAELIRDGVINSLNKEQMEGLDPSRLVKGGTDALGRTKKWNIDN